MLHQLHCPSLGTKSLTYTLQKDLQYILYGEHYVSFNEKKPSLYAAQSLPSDKSWNLEVRREGEKENKSITDLVLTIPIAAQCHHTLLYFSQNKNNVFYTGKYKCSFQKKCASETQNLEVFRQEEFNTSPVPCNLCHIRSNVILQHNLMSSCSTMPPSVEKQLQQM